MNLYNGKIASLIFSLLMLFTFASNVHAQEESSAKIDCGTPVCAEIRSSSFNEQTREAAVELRVWNNSDNFVDDLEYRLEFYNGDTLPETGYIFSGVEFVNDVTNDIQPLYPDEVATITATWDTPRSIPNGNYFLRLVVSNPDKSIFGITFDRDPLNMSGRGGFLPYLDAALIHPETGFPHRPMEGPLLSPTSTPLLVLLNNRNPELFARLEDEEIYVEYEITSLAEPDEVVAKMERYPLGLMYRIDGKEALEIPFAPWGDDMAGPYTATLSFTNFAGEEVTGDLPVRLLYEGFIGRIYEVDTGINSYKRGEPIDLIANIITAGDPTVDALQLRATLYGTNGRTQVVEKEVELSGTFSGDDLYVSFQDERITGRMVVERIELELYRENGQLIDSETINLDTDVLYKYEDTATVLEVITTLVLIIIAILVVVYVVRKKKLNIALSVALFVVAAGFVYSAQQAVVVLADATLGPEDLEVYFVDGPCPGQKVDPNDPGSNDEGETCPKPKLNGYLMKIWSSPSNEPSGYKDLCEEQCFDVEYYVKLQCKQCGNSGLGVTVDFYSSWPAGDSDKTYNLSTVVDSQYMIDHGWYQVKGDSEQKYYANSEQELRYSESGLAYAPEGSMVGVPVNANDLINYWIYGPFIDEVCFDPLDPSDTDGQHEQQYNIQATAQFGGSYCQLAFEREEQEENYETTYENTTLNDIRELICSEPVDLRVSFFIDSDEDGQYDTGENFIKSSSASASCSGTTLDLPGQIVDQTENPYNTHNNLYPSQCDTDLRPYFTYSLLGNGYHTAGLDASSGLTAGWEQTAFLLDVGATPQEAVSANGVTLQYGSTTKALVGIRTGLGATFSCTPIVPDVDGESSIIVRKVISGGTSTPDQFAFTATGPDVVTETFEADGQNSIDVADGTYDITESTVAADYSVSYSNCTNITVDSQVSEPPICTITNTYTGGGGGGGGDSDDDDSCPAGTISDGQGGCIIDPNSSGGGGGGDSDDDTNDPDCTTAPSVTISNISTDLPACVNPAEQCGTEPAYPIDYNMIGLSVSLSDTCYPDDLWFVKTYFKGSLYGNDVRKNGDSWDVAIDSDETFSSAATVHSITVDAWKGGSNNGIKEADTSDSVEHPSACEEECSSCDDPDANNFGETGACTYDDPDPCPEGYVDDGFGGCTEDTPGTVCEDPNAPNYGQEGACDWYPQPGT